MNYEKGEGVPDFVLLETLSEDALMKNLKIRYDKDRIYTYIGEVIVSVNPYKTIPDLYGPKKIEEYKGRQLYEVAPHIFSLSNNVYRNLLQYSRNQCVIISGESGAGKTEASKVLMQYIAAVSKSATYNKQVADIKTQLLESNPLLEAFGNSKTVRNDNSSRFGKYMEIQFEYDGTPVGGKITNYLLEKSRVVIRGKGERSFHIFYQLIAGLSDQDRKSLKLSNNASEYTYLALSDCVKVDTIDDRLDFQKVSRAMDILNFPKDERFFVWQIISGILHLGNVSFEQGAESANVRNPQPLENAASLLQVEAKTLARVLTSRTISTGVAKRQSLIVIPLDVVQSQFTRDALSKAIYANLFEWLVERINAKLSCQNPSSKLVVGILDIYGFEIFDNNSFEQFCINLCNEKLQQLFIELTLKSEQEEYLKEGIKWEPVQYFNNKIICDLIEGTPKGIIALMDECVLLADSTDATLFDKINIAFNKHPHYESYPNTQDRTIPDKSFRLKHYAGDVTYFIDGFLEKNKDTLFVDLVQCMQLSQNQVLRLLFEKIDVTSKKRPVTAGTQFKKALAQLMEKLLKCEPHYIRCIKPNDTKKAGFFDEQRIRHQVRYLGLFENIRVRRAGFCYRQKYERFIWRYKMICKQTWPHGGKDPKQDVMTILKDQNVSAEEYRFGHTKVFLRNPTTLFSLEAQRDKCIPRMALLMQTVWRGYKARKLLKQIKSSIVIQKTWKGYCIRKDYKTNKEKFRKQKAAWRILWFVRRIKAAKWFLALAKSHKNFLSEKAYGKYLVWPKLPTASAPLSTSLATFSDVLKRVYGKYRATKMIMSLKEDDREEMEQKVHAFSIFSGKKPWKCDRRYMADYLESDSNPQKDKYVAAVQKLFQTYGETEILFSDYVHKINRKSKVQKRVLVVTDKSIYRQDPEKYTVTKSNEVPLNSVCGVSLSPGPDTFVVVHAKAPYRDLLVDLGINGEERYAEFVTVIVDQVKEITNESIPVNFTSSIKYNNSRTNKGSGVECGLSFERTADPKQTTSSAFKLGKNNNNIILYK